MMAFHLALLALLLGGPGPRAPEAPVPGLVGAVVPALHLELESSSPAADATVASPSEIVLRFSQVPQDEATTVRLTRDGGLVEVGEARPDDDDGSVIRVAVPDELGPGGYEVRWRTMAADGHVVRGDFRFSVRAP